MPITVKECAAPACGFAFIPTKRCQEHCTGKCCKAADCANQPGKAKTLREPGVWLSDPAEDDLERRCTVCHRGAHLFERFAPCTSECHGVYFMSERKRLTYCSLAETAEEVALHHKPEAEPRVHIKYCSLRCFNSTWGHETKEADGRRRRNRRYMATRRRTTATSPLFKEEMKALRQNLIDEGVPWAAADASP